MTEHKQKAKHILNKLGVISGRKHIKQIIYLAQHLDSKNILEYWESVEKNFEDTISNQISS
jgi:hypothetical protein